jgi:hypothetical protein
MGRQTGFHMLAEDCKHFLEFVRGRDPIIVIRRDSTSPTIEEIQRPWEQGGGYCLWNQALLPALAREYIPESDVGPYYRVDSVWPVIEFSYPGPVQEPWNGRPALTQGRVWAGFERENKDFEHWYNSVVRWIRKNFIKNPVPLGGYVGPAAYDWYKNGGLLLPVFRPPITPQWLSWVEAQDQHRAVFSK